MSDLVPRVTAGVGRARLVVLAVAVVMLGAKLLMAFTTQGTNDIWMHWSEFAAGVRRAGPVGIYHLSFPRSHYNHPPLTGYYLALINWGRAHGIPLGVGVRGLSSIADVVTAVLVFELARSRWPLRAALIAGCVVAASPILLVISGFHGNTDPIFTMFVLLSTYLLVLRRMPTLSGVALAAAIGIKIIPIVAVPTLVVYAVRKGWSTALRWVVGFVALLALSWGPVVLHEWQPYKTDVLEFKGTGPGQWGLVQLGHWLGDPGWVAWLHGPGRTPLLLISAGIPALAVLRRADVVVPAVALSLVEILVLSPAWAPHYLVWAAAPSMLIALDVGFSYTALSTVLYADIYTKWSDGFPWYKASGRPMTTQETLLALLVWGALILVMVRGIRDVYAPRAHWPWAGRPRQPAVDPLPSERVDASPQTTSGGPRP